VLPEAAPPADTYAKDEIMRMLQSLTAPQKTGLNKVARIYAAKTSYGHDGHKDLIQEAYLRVLNGQREWPRNVAVVPFLAGVMRSVAWDWREKNQFDNAELELIGYEDQSAAARIDIEKIIGMFSGDPAAQTILLAMGEGARGEELRKLSGLSPTEYESKRTKIRRQLEKLAL
jgi:DNA-directed RNA polymerase specialized sigma24 family protein